MSSVDRFPGIFFKSVRNLGSLWLFPVLLILAAGCYFDKEDKVENTISFDRIADTLKQFDSVAIVLKDPNGQIIDVVFSGKVGGAADVHNLKAPHWDGGKITVSITGTKGGKTVYQVDTRMDADTETRDIQIVITPYASLSTPQSELTLLVGDSLAYPPVAVLPSSLADKALEWSSTPDGLLNLGKDSLKARQAGVGQLTVRLKSNPSVSLSIAITVSASGMVPETISILPETLNVVAGGPTESFYATVLPSAASPLVTWSSADTLIATVDAAGHVQGKSQGSTRITATSQVRPSVYASAPVKVAGPVQVEKVAFATDSLEISANGPAVDMQLSVLPLGASPAVKYTLSDPAIASVQNGKISATAVGRITVIAASVSNPAAMDTLIVRITGPIAVETVAFAKDSIEIIVGAAAESLLVSVLPAGANPAVTFTVSDTTKASVRNGKITGKAVGRITVTAASVSTPAITDNLIVRVSVPVVNDTTPPGKPTVTVKPAGPTQERKPVWTWKSGGGGAGAYQISMDKATFDSSAIALSDTTYTPAANLAAGLHVLYVRERDAANNWSAAGSAQVEVDITGPSAPKLLGPAQTSSLPRWTWSTGGNGGAGIFRSRLGDALFPANAPESGDTVFALTTAASGTTYTLYVQERDQAGNWSSASSLPIKYDLTKPTVAITLPQASGVFITATDTVTIKGAATGPNAIAKVEYVVDAGTATAVTVGTGGSFTIAALKVANAKTSTVKVTATDNLGNTGEAELQILRDSDIPLPPTALLKPPSPTNVAASTWAWSAGGDGAAGSGLNGKYRWKLNAGNWTETNTASAPSVLLAEGSNTFSVQEQDKAGNWSDALTGTAVLDTKVPDAVTFVGVDGSYTADDTPTWSWKPSTTNGGIGKYLVKLDADAEKEWDTATTYTPTIPLTDNATHTLTVKEKDQVGGVVGTAKSFSYKIKVNPPAAPVVKSAVASLANNGLTNNPGFTITSGGGGNGKYRIKVNTEATPRVNGVAQATFSLATGDADGTYTVAVAEQDDMGRYGPDGSFTIKLDRTAPVFANAKVNTTTPFPLRDNFITNQPSVPISYTADGVAKNFTCTLTDGASKLCKDAAVTDAAGNSAAYQVTIWSRSKVVFCKADGTGDGSSWEKATSDIQANAVDGKDLWLASGDYTAKSGSLDLFGRTVNIYGGFFYNSYPTDTGNRSKGTSILGSVSTMGTFGNWDGLQFGDGSSTYGLGLAMGSDESPTNIIDCTFKGNIQTVLGAVINFKNCTMSGVTSGYYPVNLGGKTITWTGGTISGNTVSPDGGPGIQIGYGATVTFKSVTISGNKSAFSSQIYDDGTLEIDNSNTFTCSDITIGESAVGGHCKGALLAPLSP